TDLPGAAVAHLQRLASEWQLLSDLAFSDLTMWVESAPGSYVCVAQARPTTRTTAHPEDLVTRHRPETEAPMLAAALHDGVITERGEAYNAGGELLERTVVPVRLGQDVIAALIQDTIDRTGNGPSALETAYTDAAV